VGQAGRPRGRNCHCTNGGAFQAQCAPLREHRRRTFSLELGTGSGNSCIWPPSVRRGLCLVVPDTRRDALRTCGATWARPGILSSSGARRDEPRIVSMLCLSVPRGARPVSYGELPAHKYLEISSRPGTPSAHVRNPLRAPPLAPVRCRCVQALTCTPGRLQVLVPDPRVSESGPPHTQITRSHYALEDHRAHRRPSSPRVGREASEYPGRHLAPGSQTESEGTPSRAGIGPYLARYWGTPTAAPRGVL
jgi:hypothetical protein